MRIGIDIRCLADGKRTGVGEYAFRVLEGIFESDKENEYVLFFNSWKKSAFNPAVFKKYPNVEIKIFRFPNKLLNFLFWYLRWPHADRMIGGADVFFMPNLNLIALSRGVKLVLTVHDLSFEYYPETFSWKRRLWHAFVNMPKLCRRADKIIAVSESTRDDIVGYYKVPESKITVVYSGAADSFRPIDRNDPSLLAVKEKYDLPYRFILFLGTIEPRKNVRSLVRAYNKMREENHPEMGKYKLVIAGGPGWREKKTISEIEKSPYRKDIVLTGFISEKDKPYLYNLASLFVYPSFFEGFGFPVLEAMKCKIPVVTSNSSSLPEIVADAGIMVDADRADEILLAMKSVLSDRSLHSRLSDQSWRQAMRFGWPRASRESLDILTKIFIE